jgi:chromate transporter
MSAVTDEAVDEARPRPASLRELFFAFNRLALQGFGGVLPVAQRELVERLGWVTRAEFIEVLSLGQVLPGPNVVNLALMLGDRFFGLRGALAALGGMLAAPLVIVLVLTAAYAELAGIAVVAGALRGMGAVAAGLILATAIRLMSTLRASLLGPWLAAAFVVVTFVTIAIVRVPRIWVGIGLGGVAIAIAWWQLR